MTNEEKAILRLHTEALNEHTMAIKAHTNELKRFCDYMIEERYRSKIEEF